MIRSVNQAMICITAAVGGSLLYFYFDPSLSNIFPPCIFYTVTGFACPGCGSQRAFHDLLHGHLLGAMDHNILFVLFLPLMLYSAFAVMNNLVSKRKMAQHLFHSPLFSKLVLLTVLAFWVLRNLPYFPFRWLAP